MRKSCIPGIFILVFTICTVNLMAQASSENGWALPVRDTLRILVLFLEIDYDTLPDLQHLPEGTPDWRPGELPRYADSIFDPFYLAEPQGKMTKYYQQASSGQFTVLGDFYPKLLRVPYSKITNQGSTSPFRTMAEILEADTPFFSANGLGLELFDHWEKNSSRGAKINPRLGAFEGVDHVMVLSRNYHKFGNSQGQASPSSFGIVGGERTDSYSLFSGGYSFPFDVLRHELNHLFLGGNNFHTAGGNSPRFTSYFLPVQGGWAMMGGSNSSLLTWCGWDRYRLGWSAPGNQFLISARDAQGNEVSGNLDALKKTEEGEYILRDFVLTGDAIRIKIPFIPEGQFEQWLWLENHTTRNMNGSPFDKFLLEDYECTSYSLPGLYMAMQVDAEEKTGNSIFGSVNADYLRPILANGNYDYVWTDEKVSPGYCVNGEAYYAYEIRPELENALTGSHEQEQPVADLAGTKGFIDASDMYATMIRKVGDGYERLNFMGNADHAFRLDGNNRIGIGSNPSPASMVTFLNARRPRAAFAKNNTEVNLNGINVTILTVFPDGTIKVKIGFEDHLLSGKRRWCAPTIRLNNHNPAGSDLTVIGTLTLDRGRTAMRYDSPDTICETLLFTDPTVMIVENGAEVENDGRINIIQDSELHFEEGSSYLQQPHARLGLGGSARLYFHAGSSFAGQGRIKIDKGCNVYCEDGQTYQSVRRRTWQKKRVVLSLGKPDEEGGT